MIGLRVDDETWAKLDNLQQRVGVDRTSLARLALEAIVAHYCQHHSLDLPIEVIPRTQRKKNTAKLDALAVILRNAESPERIIQNAKNLIKGDNLFCFGLVHDPDEVMWSEGEQGDSVLEVYLCRDVQHALLVFRRAKKMLDNAVSPHHEEPFDDDVCPVYFFIHRPI